METILSEGFKLLGVYSITLILLCIGIIYLYKYILKQKKEHLEERNQWLDLAKEWRKTTEKQFEKMNEVFKENTSVLQSLKTLLEVYAKNGKNI